MGDVHQKWGVMQVVNLRMRMITMRFLIIMIMMRIIIIMIVTLRIKRIELSNENTSCAAPLYSRVRKQAKAKI